MAAKISVNLGKYEERLPPDKAVEFFLGCSDALVHMGLFELHSMVDLVEVITIKPNQGMGTQGQIVVEVGLRWGEDKKWETFIVSLKSKEPIRAFVRDKVIKAANELAEKLRRAVEDSTQDFLKRLPPVNKQ